MLKWEKSSLPTGLMSLCFLPAFSALRPTKPLEWLSSPACPAGGCPLSVTYLLNWPLTCPGKWDKWLSALSYLYPGTQPSFTPFFIPPGFFLYFRSWQKLAIVGRRPCKPTCVQAWQQAVVDFWLKALFKVLMPSPAVWYWKSGQFACNYKASYETCSDCCPYHSYNAPIREIMPF